MIKERVQDFTANLLSMVPCWKPSSRGREAERLSWRLGEKQHLGALFQRGWRRWLLQQKLYICRNLSATTSQNGVLSNLDFFSLFLISECYLLAQGAPRKIWPSSPAFTMDFVNVGMVFLVCFASSRFFPVSCQLFSLSWGKKVSLVRKIAH